MSRPFDKARYRALLEGLEIAVLPMSDVRHDNRVFRYDTQYYGKIALAAETQIKRGEWNNLANIADGVESFGAYALTNNFNYRDEGIPFLRCVNIRGGFTDFTNALYIDAEANELLSKSEVKPGMVLLTMSGSVGNAAVALDSWKYPINSNQDIAKITPKAGINAFYLAAFLGSKFGQIQMERLPVGSVQQHIFLWMIERLVIGRLSPTTEKTIGDMVGNAYSHEANSKIITRQAEQTLLRALGLEDWQPPEPLTYTRRASDAFAAARLDADYFAPKYDAMFAAMELMGECVPLDSLLEVNRRGKQPQYAENGLPVINSKHVLKNEVRLDADNAFAITADDALTIKNGDVLINGTGVGTIGRAAPYLHDALALPDNHVTILRPHADAIDPIYLSVYLNTIAGQWQVEKYLRGSSGQIELYPVDIAQFTICLAPASIQQQIHDLVVHAFSARRQAHALLEAAKRAVEIAIEDSETAALDFLKEQEAAQ